jgi:hypothetical protein
VDNVLDEYSQRLRASKLKLLEDYLLQGIQMLIHKENFIEKVSIDEETFEVTLYRQNDDELLKSELKKDLESMKQMSDADLERQRRMQEQSMQQQNNPR